VGGRKKTKRTTGSFVGNSCEGDGPRSQSLKLFGSHRLRVFREGGGGGEKGGLERLCSYVSHPFGKSGLMPVCFCRLVAVGGACLQKARGEKREEERRPRSFFAPGTSALGGKGGGVRRRPSFVCGISSLSKKMK